MHGHVIGSHTLNHPDLSTVNDDSLIKNELVDSKYFLEQLTGSKVQHFANPYGTPESISRSAFKFAKNSYKFIHTGLRGDNSKDIDPAFILRDPICDQSASFDYFLFGPELIRSFLAGSADWIYSLRLRKLRDSCQDLLSSDSRFTS